MCTYEYVNENREKTINLISTYLNDFYIFIDVLTYLAILNNFIKLEINNH